MSSVPNPVRLTIRWLILGLVHLWLVDAEHGQRTVDLARPHIVTGHALAVLQSGRRLVRGRYLAPYLGATTPLGLYLASVGQTVVLPEPRRR